MALTRWFAQRMFGMPDGSAGALTSGGAMANLIALKVARDSRAGWDIRPRAWLLVRRSASTSPKRPT